MIQIIKEITTDLHLIILISIIANITLFLGSIILFIIMTRKLKLQLEIIKDIVTLNEFKIKDQMTRILTKFESVNQRVVVLNERLRKHFQQFGIRDIENIQSTHFVKNNVKKRGNRYGPH